MSSYFQNFELFKSELISKAQIKFLFTKFDIHINYLFWKF